MAICAGAAWAAGSAALIARRITAAGSLRDKESIILLQSAANRDACQLPLPRLAPRLTRWSEAADSIILCRARALRRGWRESGCCSSTLHYAQQRRSLTPTATNAARTTGADVPFRLLLRIFSLSRSTPFCSPYPSSGFCAPWVFVVVVMLRAFGDLIVHPTQTAPKATRMTGTMSSLSSARAAMRARESERRVYCGN
ncbi:hypothetical protein B0H16DRAFT_1517327 [Mycena metata]|uniref:Uncharacterized protein n=1 Tax=Mycena metata TaxID=1033252 RepID=A0AAD7NNM9_9AGAR|nr:hypothetical protein B0H16DRAFT_1517327 [Mycena metata]